MQYEAGNVNEQFQTSQTLMLMYFIGSHDSYQLGYYGKKKVSVKGLFVLSSATGHTETVLDVTDGFFNVDIDFI